MKKAGFRFALPAVKMIASDLASDHAWFPVLSVPSVTGQNRQIIRIRNHFDILDFV